ncbi:ABC-2 type transporter OS=Planctomyces limnophilus (strain ATCC 43296 / DSM 3776 / IFAM 1008 / 290) GN=Plim_4114 PE=4 SV=1: ABC2_membrane_3 [Gemmataceae bacterium]|nr:ABC-2 type transporter OS=Planctomyces limnophilus (strain ATCC 43296 / DSM 3776 / IFAM 1008 / 290) GN=Plim_4114 PE=4 SV=1: ABC2_membrane_3 [Gemmataceae bacterium]VTU02110.1 ABC-2 type transporter OS=Planctomyces limnophilus (strain ATCC 43296 / DSM 3776 / IFAM 1008 / 290) GN=Plim_4114 PE=4 SV=1: ABC2_membrane_3 [Gemmataceae bacterium]
MPILTLAAKDLRLLLRDARSAVILLVTPLVLILVLGMALGEGFGEKPDDRLRISVVNLDRGLSTKQPFPEKMWSEVVMDDLTATAGIRLELITDRAEAEKLVARNRRAAVIVFEPEFSERMNRCSFLSQATPPPINPFDRDGVRTAEVGLTLLKDQTQPVTASTIEQVAQVTLLRVLIPWMIGRAFERVGDDAFMESLAVKLKDAKPLPPAVLKELDPVVQKLLDALMRDPEFAAMMLKAVGFRDAGTIAGRSREFKEVVSQAFNNPKLMARVGRDIAFGEVMTPAVRAEVGPKVRDGVQEVLSNYDFKAKTWAGLNKDRARSANPDGVTEYRDTSGTGFLNRGAVRYQILVPSYTVMFAFFLVLSVGWLFVAERKHGTLARLRAAPLARGQILMGKLLPCLAVSLAQGFFLLAAGWALFGMTWGSRPDLLAAVVVCTSLAAVGLSVFVASIARTETQVAVYGTLLVLVLGGVSGSLMPRDLMPEKMKAASLATPHAWALDAYSQLLANPVPDAALIATACGVLAAFGAAFTALAWWRMDLE